MTNRDLSESYLEKAKVRLEVLDLLFRRKAYSDVVREAQEAVELALKALLRREGIEPPKWHDVSELLLAKRERLPVAIQAHVNRLVEVSQWLRRERELAFYGDVDFIPTEQYGETEAVKALEDARFVVQLVSSVA